jgi:hypothetical protein
MIDDIGEEEYSELIQKLIDMGVLEVVGFDQKSNQFTYGITPKCQELFPELFDEHFKMINELAFKLWNAGHIEMAFDTDGTPMVMIKDLEHTIKVKDTLPDEERFFLENLIYKHQEDMKRK